MTASPLLARTDGEAPAAAIARIEASARRVSTPNGTGEMVWRVWGSGPPLVLLHGGHGSWRHWIRTIPAFAADHSVWAPDLPGLGDSGDFDGRVPEGVAAIVAQGLAAILPAGRPFDLVGFSFGALVSGHVAALLGRMIRSLTLVGPGALGVPRRTVELQKWRHDMPDAQLRDIHRANLQRLMIADPDNTDELAVLIQMQNTSRARVRSRSAATSDSLALALRRSCPRRLNAIWGECDAVAYPYLAERKAFFHALRPDAGFYLLPQAGHWAAYEAADAFNALLRTLLNGAEPTR
jgi:pimeloyl-ACP methyl ester carboxylesterase